jgi:hypothetical protein
MTSAAHTQAPRTLETASVQHTDKQHAPQGQRQCVQGARQEGPEEGRQAQPSEHVVRQGNMGQSMGMRGQGSGQGSRPLGPDVIPGQVQTVQAGVGSEGGHCRKPKVGSSGVGPMRQSSLSLSRTLHPHNPLVVRVSSARCA